MSQAIGFANKFYTLWSIDIEPVYTTDAYGNPWLTRHNIHYTYHKNISFDLDKAKALYPNLEVQEDLRGKTHSWTFTREEDDLCPQIMKFGKYYSKDINELLEQDFNYVVWLAQNSNSGNGLYAKNLSKIKEHFKSIEDAANKLINDNNNTFKTIVDAGSFEFVAERNLKIREEFAYISVDCGGINITFKFNQGTFSHNTYNGFDYGLPLIKGKAKRMKGKTVKFQFTEDKTDIYQVIVHNVII